MNRLVVINIPQIVKKRVYEVDTKKLQRLLREQKKEKQLTIKTISNELGIPKTMTEHFFRTDKYFDIPDPVNWKKLSELLDISDKELEKQITTFEYVDGIFEKSERHYFEGGIAPTILSGINDKIIVSEQNASKSNSTNGQHDRSHI
jgi:hypothetical protein